jgi:[ribosomal protein S18]-alanine N-acetyltransferase
VKVRPARLEDWDAIARGMKEVVEEGRWLATEAGTPIEDVRERFRAAFESDEHLLFALWDGDELVGSLGMHPSGADGVLGLGMWVLRSHRGRGGGRMLMEAALEAVPPAIHKVELEVFPDNDVAIGLYRSLGFEEEGLRRDHYRRQDGTLRSALLMARLFPDEAAPR